MPWWRLPAPWLLWSGAWVIINTCLVQTYLGDTSLQSRLLVAGLFGVTACLAFVAGRRVEAERKLRDASRQLHKTRALARRRVRVVARHVPSMDAGRDIWN
jgi:hypothetical protein